MWKPLSIVSGVALLAAGGITYTMVRPAYIAEHKQTEASGKNLASAEKLKLDAEAAEKQADKDLESQKSGLTKSQAAKAAAAAEKEEVAKAYEEQVLVKDSASKELDDTKKKIADFGDIPTMASELKSLESKRIAYDRQIESAKSGIASAISRKTGSDKLISSVKRIDLWQRTGTMADSFSSRVVAVNPDWGFVKIGAGNSASVVNNAKLDVTRGGSVVGTVIVTHVDPSTSTAEIVPGSVAAGDSILPGDRVVVNEASKGSKMKVEAPAAKAEVPAADAPPEAGAAPAEAAPAPAPAAVDPFAPPTEPAPATPVEPATEGN